MRPIIFAILFPFILIAATLQVRAQQPTSCDGSLGDPVINQTFGSGSNPGAPLPAGVTNMTYTTSNCPEDGYYTIVNSINLNQNCHTTWQSVTSDHTGNPNGYMMVVNASAQPSVFFTQSAPTLCPGTTYQFSAYILNLITLAASGPGVSEPNITFSVLAPDGTVLATKSTGTIDATQDPVWNQESLYFTTPDNVSSVTVAMTNNAPGGNGNDLILDDITFRACGPVIDAGFGSVTGPAAQPLCQGANATLTLDAKVGGNTNPNYQWQSYHTNGGWVDTAGQTAPSLNVVFQNAVPGSYQYRVGITNGTSTLASCRTYSAPLIVNVSTNPVIGGVPLTQSICEGDTLSILATGGVTYQWSGPNLSPISENPLVINGITLADAGKYTVTAYNQYSCPSTASTQITVNPKPVATISGITTICAGKSTQLVAQGGVAYQWSPAGSLNDPTVPNPIATPTDTTTYTVKVYNQAKCYATETATVNVLKTPVANAGPNKIIVEGQSVKLNGSAQNGDVFYWTPNSYISGSNTLDPIVTPNQDATYTLHVTSTSNCGIDSSKVFVRVYQHVEIPNTFSPNNDGINDLWNIAALSTYPESLLQVFNRYGTQVFQSIGYSKPWDGKYNGRVLPAGTYYYVIDLKNNTPKISGWVVIVR
ncbi:gliding motility-associated C-terminal domain-containing protein [Mucilaginibacter mallensis]|uniref:Gliding motility-associated C-terminal domain-containing protein n=1 Tax=Mucilaginibacter mallensis TaxID=652787 RepID=A0A1H2C955_MUCMA|nr:gliding motility-associated C-terminal domain-containing protein [Mucilaginibacter mallensis]SDT66921.1 gliding motility-associated C-terminal domain-containing protein [Mucilaginibacter mallensis]